MGRTVAVVGAGIVGVSAALWLSRAGHAVTLIDRAGPGEGASLGNGGVLAASAVVPVPVPGLLAKAPRLLLDPREPLFLRWAYLPRLTPWLRRYLSHANAADVRRTAAALTPLVQDSLAEHEALAAGTGAERYVIPSDYHFLYRDAAHFRADAFAWSVRAAMGYAWEEVGRQALLGWEPGFSEAVGHAARLPGHGRISDPGAYVRALADHAVARGVRVLRAEVTDIVREAGRVTGVRAGGETLPCEAVVIATGAWSKPLAARLGLVVPIETERGYHVEFWAPSSMPPGPAMLVAGKFVMTPMEGRLRIAGVVEFGGLAAPPSRAPFALLRHHLRATLPGLTWREETEWMGHRPAPADSIPLIGPVPGVEGAFLGFGHHHVGLTAGPKTGRLLAQLAGGLRPNLDLAPYAPARFA